MEFVPKKLYYKIREACEIVGVEAHVLRFWETEFPSLTPPKSKSGQRTYRPKDIELLLQIRRLLYEEGYTIAGARKQLSSRGSATPQPLRPQPVPPPPVSLQEPAQPKGQEKPAQKRMAEAKYQEEKAVEANFEDLLSSVTDEVAIGRESPPEPEPESQEKNAKLPDVKEGPVPNTPDKSPGKPTSDRLKRVQAELENILTLLDRE